MWNELFITGNPNSLFCELLANYTKLVDKQFIRILKIKQSTADLLNIQNLPFLITFDQTHILGELEISQFLCKLAGKTDVLFGRTEDEINSHVKFITEFNANSNKMAYLNDMLFLNTFCNGNKHITVSDLYAFSHALIEIQQFDYSAKRQHSNLIRWAVFIQSLQGIKEQILKLKMCVKLPVNNNICNLNLFETETKPPVNVSINTSNTELNDKKKEKGDKGKTEKPKGMLN